ncbi:hypothetical protein [Bacteroides helcogenes]|nr:hypothetical protein [Bacteroides helcogenes]MDY5237602.1 hypothetical protein [Bacteroides helcogenes]
MNTKKKKVISHTTALKGLKSMLATKVEWVNSVHKANTLPLKKTIA